MEDPKDERYHDLDRLAWLVYLSAQERPDDLPEISREEFLRVAGEFYDAMMGKEKPGA